MSTITTILSDALLETFLIFVGLGCALSLVVGLWMLFKPSDILRLNRYLSRWFATDKLANMLDSPHKIERALYRNHRVVGILVLGGSTYILYTLLVILNKKEFANLLGGIWNAYVAAWLVEALVISLVAGSVLAMVVGVFMLIRPSLLKDFEARVNSWYATDKSLQAFDTMHTQPDELVAHHTRIVGVLIVAGSVYAIVSLWMALL